MTDTPPDLFDTLALCIGLIVIAWIGWHTSKRTSSDTIRQPAAVIGMLVWLAAFGIALYLAFG